MTKKAGRKTKEAGRKTKSPGQRTRGDSRSRTPASHRARAPIFGGISHLFAGRAVVSLLRLFFLHTSRDFYQRELTGLTGERLFLIQNALKRLVRAGVVGQVSRGNRTYYRVDPSHPAYEHLKALILKTVGLGDRLRTHLAGMRDNVKIAFIYGSVARGEETPSSDIDIMLIGDLSGRQVASLFAPLKKYLNREINPSVYSASEFRRKFQQRHPFVRQVLNEPKVFLLGDERALEGIVGRRSSATS